VEVSAAPSLLLGKPLPLGKVGAVAPGVPAAAASRGPSSTGPHCLRGGLFPPHPVPGDWHANQTRAELGFLAVKYLYLFINQKPDTKAALFNIYTGVSKPHRRSRAGGLCLHTWRALPPAWTLATASRGPPPTLVPPPEPQQATASSSSPHWTWDQRKCGLFSCPALQGREAAVLESTNFATSTSTGSLCIKLVSSGPW